MPLLRCRYRAHLSKEQVAELVVQHHGTFELVNSWLEHHGIPPSTVSVTHGGNWLTLTDVPVSRANELLGASYQLYRHAKTNETTLRTVSYALPAALHGHVQTVAPTTCFVSPLTQWQTSASSEPVELLSSGHDNDHVTPSYLRWLYNTVDYVPAAAGKNALGIVGFVGDYPILTDLAAFMDKYRSDATEINLALVQVNDGGYTPSLESNIDSQTAEGIANPTPHIFYSSGRRRPGSDDYLTWLGYIIDQPSVPQTISISYGTQEKLYSWSYSRDVCSLFAQLGARGVSVLVASGDSGVGPEDCKTDRGNVQFIPNFPASCTCGISLSACKQCTSAGTGRLTRPPRFRRSLCHCRRRNDESHAGSRSGLLRRRLL
jgi:tripeptidyl-peptidase-1